MGASAHCSYGTFGHGICRKADCTCECHANGQEPTTIPRRKKKKA